MSEGVNTNERVEMLEVVLTLCQKSRRCVLQLLGSKEWEQLMHKKNIFFQSIYNNHSFHVFSDVYSTSAPFPFVNMQISAYIHEMQIINIPTSSCYQ